MREQKNTEASWTQLAKASTSSSLATWAVRAIPDCFTSQKIACTQSKTFDSWQNIRRMLAWDALYRLSANASFPIQHVTKQTILNQLEEKHHTTRNILFINALSGWFASMVELTFYPLDSMRILAHTRPTIFTNQSIRYFFTHQTVLRRGIGLAATRNTLVNPIAWSAKMYVPHKLEDTSLSTWPKLIAATLTFSIIRIALGYPFFVINILSLSDGNPPKTHTLKEKQRYFANIINKRYQTHGLSGFYTGAILLGSTQLLTTFLSLTIFDYFLASTHKSVMPHNPFWSIPTTKIPNTEEKTHENRR